MQFTRLWRAYQAPFTALSRDFVLKVALIEECRYRRSRCVRTLKKRPVRFIPDASRTIFVRYHILLQSSLTQHVQPCKVYL